MNIHAPAARSHDQSGGDWTDTGLKVLAGAAAGAVAVWVMDRADWFMWDHESEESRARTLAVRPNGEAPAEALVTTAEDMLGKRTDPDTHSLLGKSVHYGIGIGPAIVYALLRDRLPVEGPVRGALYGTGLFLAQDEVLNTVTGLGARPQDYPWQAHARGLVSHNIYGIVVETALNLMEQALDRAQRSRVDA